MLRSVSVFIIFALLGASTLSAENSIPAPDPWTISVQWDNDLLTGTDEGYTNGVRFAMTRTLSPDSTPHNQLQNGLFILTGTETKGVLGDLRFPDAKALRFQYGIGLSQLMFTPRDPQTLTPPPGERPYAAWSGLEFSLQASAANSASTATLSIGTTGDLSHGRDTQDWVHKNISQSPTFQGWGSQAPGELTLNLHLDHKRRAKFLDRTEDRCISIDGFSEWGASLGNLRTDFYIGGHLRAGWNLPHSHLSPRVQLGSFTETLFSRDSAPKSDFSLYGFAGVRGYGVLQEITLDGPLFRDWSNAVDSKPWLAEFSFGLAAQYRSLELSLSQTLRSDEFDGQKNRSRYGSVLLRLGGKF